MRVARAPKFVPRGAKLHLECGLEGQVAPQRRQVALGVRLGAVKCGPRGATLRPDWHEARPDWHQARHDWHPSAELDAFKFAAPRNIPPKFQRLRLMPPTPPKVWELRFEISGSKLEVCDLRLGIRMHVSV